MIIPIATQSGSVNEVRRILKASAATTGICCWMNKAHCSMLWTGGCALVLVIDSDGQIRHIQTGYTSELGMRARIWSSQF